MPPWTWQVLRGQTCGPPTNHPLLPPAGIKELAVPTTYSCTPGRNPEGQNLRVELAQEQSPNGSSLLPSDPGGRAH